MIAAIRAAVLGLLLVLAAAASAQAAPTHAAAHASRAVWTWERPSYAMLESPQVADEALAFLQRKRIDVVYLYADAFQDRNLLVQQPARYHAFIRAAHARGIRVYALLGSWYLHTERYVLPRHQRKAVAMLQRVLDYNAARVHDLTAGFNARSPRGTNSYPPGTPGRPPSRCRWRRRLWAARWCRRRFRPRAYWRSSCWRWPVPTRH